MKPRSTRALIMALTAALSFDGAAAAPRAAGGQQLRAPSQLQQTAPATFRARFDTSKGAFVIEAHRDWSPHGVDRFYNLVKNHFYDDCRFYRVISRFLVEFGINGDSGIQKAWAGAAIPDDPVRQNNKRGFVTFAKGVAPNSRSTQIFINLGDNLNMDESYVPFGQVTAGMDVVDALYGGYAGEPQKQLVRIHTEGNAFLEERFPKLDYVRTATIDE
jgi:peptidyl-prolyl cis-trans isomerase A (cyclophilin A)